MKRLFAILLFLCVLLDCAFAFDLSDLTDEDLLLVLQDLQNEVEFRGITPIPTQPRKTPIPPSAWKTPTPKPTQEPTPKPEWQIVGDMESTTAFGHYRYLIVRCNNKYPTIMDVNVIYYGKNGEIVDLDTSRECSCGNGNDYLFIFRSDADYWEYEYEITTKADPSNECVASYLKTNSSIVDDRIIIEITNSGDVDAYLPHYQIIFFKDGKVCGHAWGYGGGNDMIIPPGETEYSKTDLPVKYYQNYKLYINGFTKE